MIKYLSVLRTTFFEQDNLNQHRLNSVYIPVDGVSREI